MYNFTVTGQRGTLWWHAHILWLRATVHGAIVILPKLGVPYPFPAPDKEAVVLLGDYLFTNVLVPILIIFRVPVTSLEPSTSK